MSVRSFTVFQDIDPDAAHPPPADTATLLSTLAAIEKENLHPLTGLRAGPAIGSDAKKRKTAALATKALPAPASKKKGEPKKSRKPLASAPKHRSSKTPKSCPSRKASPLPPVAEEQELRRQPPRLSISQTDIDSRCYELTVSPLADVSEAYDPTRLESQEDVHTERENSVQPAIRDYFSPSTADKPLPTTNETSDFSTPERKRTYSAFTFTSPSPTSERFKQAQMSPTPSAPE